MERMYGGGFVEIDKCVVAQWYHGGDIIPHSFPFGIVDDADGALTDKIGGQVFAFFHVDHFFSVHVGGPGVGHAWLLFLWFVGRIPEVGVDVLVADAILGGMAGIVMALAVDDAAVAGAALLPHPVVILTGGTYYSCEEGDPNQWVHDFLLSAAILLPSPWFFVHFAGGELDDVYAG